MLGHRLFSWSIRVLYHPINLIPKVSILVSLAHTWSTTHLFLVNIAAIGKVLAIVPTQPVKSMSINMMYGPWRLTGHVSLAFFRVRFDICHDYVWSDLWQQVMKMICVGRTRAYQVRVYAYLSLKSCWSPVQGCSMVDSKRVISQVSPSVISRNGRPSNLRRYSQGQMKVLGNCKPEDGSNHLGLCCDQTEW